MKPKYKIGDFMEAIGMEDGRKHLYGKILRIVSVDIYDELMHYQVELISNPGVCFWMYDDSLERTLRAIVEQTVAENKNDTENG